MSSGVAFKWISKWRLPEFRIFVCLDKNETYPKKSEKGKLSISFEDSQKLELSKHVEKQVTANLIGPP